jgi:urease accessory protein
VTGAGLQAAASVRARRGDDGRTFLDELRSAPPLSLRHAGGSLWLVGTAAGPLAGDRVHLNVDVGPGARLSVRSTAASVVLGGPGVDTSRLDIEVEVASGAELQWLVEPTVATAGARHDVTTSIRLTAGARLVWREELVLGRHDEGPGALSSRIDILVDGRPALRQELRVGSGAPEWSGPAVLGRAKATGMVVVVDPTWSSRPRSGRSLGPDAAVLALPGGAAMVSAVASGAHELRCRLDRGLAVLLSLLGG